MFDDKLLRNFIGFDDLWKFSKSLPAKLPSYPPYNLKRIGDNKYVLEVAVAGFSKNQLEIELADDKLVISGISKEPEDEEYVYQGLAARSFKREWVLADNIEIKNAKLVNGVLQVILEALIKGHEAIKIDISE